MSPALMATWQQAEAHFVQGDLTAARDLLEPAAEVATSAFGPDHPDVLETLRRLALVYRGLADWSAARRVLEEALAAGLLRYGDADPLILALSAELGTAAEQLGNRHEARRNFTRVAQYGPGVLGEGHPYVHAAQTYLGGPVYVPKEPVHLPKEPVHVPKEPVYIPREPGEPVHIPEQTQPRTPAKFGPPPPPPELDGARKRRWLPLVMIVVAGLLTAGVLLFVARPHRPAPGGPSAGPSIPVLTPPADVKLRDSGASITLTWKDPDAGTLPFIVSGGRAGEQSHPYPPLPPGQTTFTVNGLNANVDYCFTVVAIYATDRFAPSDLVCTRRVTTPAPKVT